MGEQLKIFAVGQNKIANGQQRSEIDLENSVINTSKLKKEKVNAAERLISHNANFIISSRINPNQEPSISKILAPNAATKSSFSGTEAFPINVANDLKKTKPQKINTNYRPSLKLPDFLLTTPVPWTLDKDPKIHNEFGKSTRYFQPVRSFEFIPPMEQRMVVTQISSELPIKNVSPRKNQKSVLPQGTKAVPHAFELPFGQWRVKSSQTSAPTHISRSNSFLGRKIYPYDTNENTTAGKKFIVVSDRKHESTPNVKFQANLIKPVIPTLGVLEFDSKVINPIEFEKSIKPFVGAILSYGHSEKNAPENDEKPSGDSEINNKENVFAKEKTFVDSLGQKSVGPRLKVPQENEIRLVVNLTPYRTVPSLVTHLPSLGSKLNEPPKSKEDAEGDANKPTIQNYLSILKETNRLPKNLTPENIENGITTLAFILEKLQKEKQIENIQLAITPTVSVVGKKTNKQNSLGTETHKEPKKPYSPYSQGSESGTPGRPGIDYPIHSSIPQTKFDCSTQRYKGFFGDPETKCQVWHYCDLNGGQASFLCPNGTIFSQVALTCDWWFNVKCASTSQLYVLNERLYKYILPFSPSFPEDYSGPVVDRYLTAKFKEMERKSKLKALSSSSATTSTTLPGFNFKS